MGKKRKKNKIIKFQMEVIRIDTRINKVIKSFTKILEFNLTKLIAYMSWTYTK